MKEITVIARHVIHDNIDGNFELTGHIDSETGESKLKSIPRVTQPGQWQSFPEALARDLIASDAARLPTEQERQLRALAMGVAQ